MRLNGMEKERYTERFVVYRLKFKTESPCYVNAMQLLILENNWYCIIIDRFVRHLSVLNIQQCSTTILCIY